MQAFPPPPNRALRILAMTACCAAPLAWSQQPQDSTPPPVQISPAPATQVSPAPAAPAQAPTSTAAPATQYGPTQSGPIAIVPLDSKDPASAAMVTGALQVANGRAMIATNGAITSGVNTTEVTLPRRGVLRVCASTTVKLASDASVPQGEIPGLMMVLDHGAVEASFATGRNSDVLLTPDFRILIGAPGSADVKVRLGQHGDTCVDNAGTNAPYVLVTSVFDGGTYRVQPGQRVMFQHGSLREVVDDEKEPCGCPAEPRPGTNDFPLAESAGLTTAAPPVTAPPAAPAHATPNQTVLDTPLEYEAQPAQADKSQTPAPPAPESAKKSDAPPASTPTAKSPAQKKPGLFRRIGHFFKRVFGAE
jgi:hypothetical protein